MKTFSTLFVIVLAGLSLPGCVPLETHKQRITSFDGAELDVWAMSKKGLAPADRAKAPTVVIFHGWLGDKHFFESLGEKMARKGWNVVLFDQRNHGLSSRMPTTWGAKEKKDAKIVVDKLLADGLISEEIYAFGGSMGGCHAVQYGAIDPRCRGIFALVPVNGIKGAKQRILPLATEEQLETTVQLEAKINGFNAADSDPEVAAATLTVPLIVVGAQFDVIVPKEQCRAIYDAAPQPKEYIELGLTGHIFAQRGRDDWLAKKLLELRATAQKQAEEKAATQPASAPVAP